MAKTDRWTRFGWHGVSFDVPADWELRRFYGTRRRGYARLADPDAARIEVRWEQPRRATDLGELADRVVRQMGRKGGLEIERHTGLASPPGKECETLTCRPKSRKDASSYDLISLCRECGRLVMMRVLFQRGENTRPTARRIMDSLQDHTYDGVDVWAAYGLEFAVPETMELDKALIYPGSVDFRFLYRADRIDVGRLALGSVILRRMTLTDWFPAFARKRFKKVKYEMREAPYRGHPGLEITGRLRGIGALAPRLVRRQRFLCRLWHCEASDRILFYATLARPKRYERFASFADRVVCH